MSKVSWARKTPFATDEDATIQEGLLIKSKMTGNANFDATDTVALLATFTTTLGAYQTAFTAAEKGGTDLTAAKVVARVNYLGALFALGSNVNSVVKVLNISVDAKNAMLETSGFPLSGTNHTAQPLPQPENLRASYPQAGELVMRVNKVKNARSYKWQYRESGATPATWKDLPDFKTLTKVRLLAQDGGIASGKKYDFQVLAQGANPTENWSIIFTTDYVR